jgi:hypothetical protein
MRKIKFKSATESDYKMFIDIGSCEKHYDFLPLFDSEEESFSQWQESFAELEMGVQMLTLHYYLLEYTENNDIPEEIHSIISSNLDVLSEFNVKWFDPTAPFFKGLDLNWEDIESEIDESEENDLGVMTYVKFKNGDEIKFLDEDDDTISSFYVAEEDFLELIETWQLLLQKLVNTAN